MLVCPNCDVEYEAGKNFCRHCGSPLVDKPSAAPASGIAGDPWRAAQVNKIAAVLHRITSEGGDGNFAIFWVDRAKNYYIQFGAVCGFPTLDCEAVNNTYLQPAFKLDDQKISRLLSLGWHRGPEQHTRQWQAAGEKDRLQIADTVLTALVEVYGLMHGQELEVEMALEDL